MNKMTQQDTIELYDLLGTLNSPIQHIGGLSATKELLEMIGINDKSDILDIGCGGGWTATEIAKEYRCHVTGIDISEVMIAQAKKRAKKKKVEKQVDFRLASVFELPFEDNTFDLAFFESFLNVLQEEDREKALREIARVVKPGGKIGGNEPTRLQETPSELVEELKEVVPFLGTTPTSQELEELFKTSSLQEITTKEYPASMITSGMVMGDIMKTMGLRSLMSYIVRMLYYYIKDPKLRQYTKMSRTMLKDKKSKKYFGGVYIVGQK